MYSVIVKVMFAKAIFVALLTTTHAGNQRKLTAYPNPFCDVKDCGLCYVTAEGTNDTVHYFWSTLEAPAALSIRTSPGGMLTSISWEALRTRNFSASTFNFSEPVLSSSAVVISKLWEYNDPDNKVHMNSSLINGTHFIDQSRLKWGDIEGCAGNGSSLVAATFVASGTTLAADEGFFNHSGTIQFTVQVRDSDGHDSQLPHLFYTSDSSQLQFSLLDLSPQLGKTSQFAFELTILDDQSRNYSLDLSKETTFDDEYTPGVFTNVALLHKDTNSSSLYLHWKPVCYRDPQRTVTLSVDATESNLIKNASWWSFNLATAWLAHRTPDVASSAISVAFGSEGDNWYQEYHYATWAMSTGFGESPRERVSATVLSVTSVGLGIPAIIALATVIYVSLHKPEPKL